MDIAKIRKKAQTRGGRDPSPCASEEFADSRPAQPLPMPPQTGTELPADRQTVLAAPGMPEVESSFNDGLDRLFAAVEDFSLASEESYANILDSRAGDQNLVWRQYLAFHLGDEEYALDITQISEIIKVREFTEIPRSPAFILGIISLRGVVVPVFDLRQRLRLGPAEISPASRIIVSQNEDITAGLLVDSINQVVKLADSELEPPPGVLSGLDRDMVTGIGRSQGNLIILLNLRSVLAVDLREV